MKGVYDCIVIGGGPAGMMAAISAGQSGKRVLLLEKNNSLGKKLLLTGNGRCNLSHKEDSNRNFVLRFGKQGDFLLSPFSVFGPEETIRFFRENGLEVIIENNGKVFPKSNEAKSVLNLLLQLMRKNKVEVRHGSRVKDLIVEDKKIVKVVLSDGEEIEGFNFILTTGGKSFSQTGSDGEGLNMAEKIGHSISLLYPGLCPLKINKADKSLSGISLADIGVSFSQVGRVILRGRGDILFTHFGVTGPLILDLSNELGPYLEKGEVILSLDLFPAKDSEELADIIESNRSKTIKNILSILMPEKVALAILNLSAIDYEKKGLQLKKMEKEKIIKSLKNFQLIAGGLMGFDEAMITKGGVSLREIDSRNMRSKIIRNLYFAGEIIDLAGISGGYNLQLCWSTGYVAGQLK